jgi:predicted O-linked N-acetylglucosamine transferase (SPINDLY family)
LTISNRNAPCPCGSGKKYKKCCIDKVIPAQPEADRLQAIFASGYRLLSSGQGRNAAAQFQRYICLVPWSTDAFLNLGTAYAGERLLDIAIRCFRRALQIKPDYAQAHNSLGSMLNASGRLDDAIQSFENALTHLPDYAEAHYNLGNALKNKIRLDAAIASYRRAIALKPDYTEAYTNLGSALRLKGEIGGAVGCYLKALSVKPDFAGAYSNLLFLCGYHGLGSPHDYLGLAKGWEHACISTHDRAAAGRRRLAVPRPRQGRRLRIGYVSGDFRQHAVSYFIEQVLAGHDRGRFEVFAYPTHDLRDAVTGRLNSLVDAWIPVTNLSDEEARDRIAADCIDVLIDLSGHTDHNRLGIFALRAAPVQAHYLGYFATTGLTEIDYWIGDEILTPAAHDIHFCEKVWRLPRIRMAYRAGSDAPEPAWTPDPAGIIRVGSFNDLSKLTAETLALWARILKSMPEGRLLLKASELADPTNRRRILDQMAGHGVEPQRIELRDRSSTPDWTSHMAYHDRLDIALDPLGGHGGATTTCDALWMAVPVITMEGDRAASRMTSGLVSAIGHPEWIAADPADYVGKVVALSRDTAKRQELRVSQRKNMSSSPLCDGSGLARSLENAYECMFDRLIETSR